MDFFGVTLAGRHEPLADILAEQIAEDGGTPQATVIGRGTRANIEQAALLNGAMSHALDFDDVNFTSAAIRPCRSRRRCWRWPSIASSTASGCSKRSLPASRPSAASAGWSAARTISAAGTRPPRSAPSVPPPRISNMLRLDAATTAHALGIAATQAAGLKSVFGTMCKPLHPGRAAAIGLQAARLAQRGFTSNPAILDVEQGFTATASENPNPDGCARGAAGRLLPAADALQVSRRLLSDAFLDRGEQHAAA